MSKKNIFAKFQDYVNKPKRNVFDLSFANNITTKFGQLTPVFCKECIPGDSFKIHSRFALQMMPMKFPVQTPMRAYLHFFYVRNRTLYKDWMDFIGGTKDNLTLPYVQPTDKKKFYRVGGLADYLGVPNVLYDSESENTVAELPVIGVSNAVTIKDDNDVTLCSYTFQPFATTSWVEYSFLHFLSASQYTYWKDYPTNTSSIEQLQAFASNAASYLVGTNAYSAFNYINSTDLPNPWSCYTSYYDDSEADLTHQRAIYWSLLGRITSSVVSNTASFEFKVINNSSSYAITMPVIVVKRNTNNVITSVTGSFVTASVSSTAIEGTANYEHTLRLTCDLYNNENNPISEFYTIFPCTTTISNGNKTYKLKSLLSNGSVVKVLAGRASEDLYHVVGDSNLGTTPYDSDIHLNALPFRAYEAIYNSYYRNAQNNPYVLNGVAEYNKYIPSYDGGADTNDYDLHQRNWEYDFLTSAVQTPQQGDIAPLVGISVTGEATFQDEDGNTYYASASYDENGNITGWTSHSPNMPQGSLRLLMDMAGTGISINDLRNVNAFQKFLENNIRRGLKYRDQIKSHFGVDVRYDELDMPEFIGGCSTDINVNKLSQTSESGSTPLGSFVGQASAYGESKHDITHYCDEHGFIIGIMSIVPVPVYSQLLPKFFLKSEQLDYFFPEFGHIGYQPILQKEVSPLQTYYTSGDLNKVFGYQRSWYDYLDSTDEVHGQFRTTMRDFLMNRTFEDEPELSRDFLLVDPDQLNDVFLAGTDDDDIYAPDSDKIIGSLYFNVSKKSPIPLFGIPRLD